MMEEWKEYRLGDVCTIVGRIGFRGYTTEDLTGNPDDGAITLSPTNIIEGEIELSKPTFIKWPKYYESPEIMLEQNDIVLVKTGSSIGRTARIREIVHPMTLNPQFVVLKEIKTDNVFLSYVIKSSYFQALLKTITVGSAIPTLSQKNLSNLIIKVPDIIVQCKIAAILSSLDDKIEVNKRINDNLEQQAQTLFKSWFVDFEPFNDGEFEESELGMIPKGWSVEAIDNIVEISKKSINPNKYPEVQFVHYSIPSYDNGKQPEKQYGREILSNKFVVKDKMTLFSKLNPRIKRVWFVNDVADNSICSTEFVPYMAHDIVLSAFAYCLIYSQGFYDFVMSMVNGATGSHQRFHPEETLSYRLAFNKEQAMRFSKLVEPMIAQILKNQQESRRLAELRDTLLPRLMSGEFEVKEIMI